MRFEHPRAHAYATSLRNNELISAKIAIALLDRGAECYDTFLHSDINERYGDVSPVDKGAGRCTIGAVRGAEWSVSESQEDHRDIETSMQGRECRGYVPGRNTCCAISASADLQSAPRLYWRGRRAHPLGGSDPGWQGQPLWEPHSMAAPLTRGRFPG